ncbi:MAG TPA: crotonase/enoyl-CoA hydratase family protein [Streptosporangiaceae bacterium]|jgi:enoyl-CoA hydratase/carnithine racemase
MTDRVTVSVTDGVADVRMNRPDKLNALDGAMFAALAETGEAVAADASVRAVVLSGEGRSFCAGLDFGSFSAMAGDGPADESAMRRMAADPVDRLPGKITNLGQQAVYAWTEMPQPVIAAVSGHALGGGIQIALGADLRIVAPDAKMSVLEIKWGLVPDMTGTAQLVRLVGLDVAKELTFTGRTVDGAEAVRLGLATRVADDPRAAALALAGELAGRSPDAIRQAKRLLNAAVQTTRAEAFLEESKALVALRGGANQVEAITATFEKRAPKFADPS